MTSAFCDEAGTHPGARASVFACYAAPPEEWDRFKREWRGLLKYAGVPHFHASPCIRRRKLFKDKTEAQCLDYHAKALEIITGHALMGVAVAGVHDNLRGEWVGRVKPGEGPNVFDLAVLSSLTFLAMHSERKWPGERVAVVYERCTPQDNALGRV